jgi:dTDP-4-dehydrorhamnose 3,5-epimerase
MKFTKTKIPDVLLITPKIFEDDRGFFLESYQDLDFMEAGIYPNFVQENHSGSKKGVLRGLHYQSICPQGKLIKVAVGEIFDVAVDLRVNSKTFGQWISFFLSSYNKKQLWIPVGFAHGFYVVSDWAEVYYKTTNYYNPDGEHTIIWNDLDLNIDWPTDNKIPLLSKKDMIGENFKDAIYF